RRGVDALTDAPCFEHLKMDHVPFKAEKGALLQPSCVETQELLPPRMGKLHEPEPQRWRQRESHSGGRRPGTVYKRGRGCRR
ncbi:unnamed protein product, partial [Ectocarpus sp. 12 AP-2014]